ncbi:MAG: DUF2283 domain-containing protein [Elusimicrobiota bacterium]
MAYNISYEPEADVLTIRVSKEGKIDDAEMVGDVVLHWDKNGNPVMVEFLNATKIVPKMVEAFAKRELAVVA